MSHTSKEQGTLLLPVPIRTQRAFLLLLFCWFSGQAILRTLISPTANLDEAEQLMLTQEWALGYGPQPPLYTWLQSAIFSVAGVSIASLAILKNALLFGTYSLAYLNARLITGRHDAGLVAALSLFLIPQIAWESQRDLTHSVLAATLALATLYAFLKARTGSWRSYLLLGCALGLGAISKYNYAIWAAGLLLAAVSVESFRRVIFSKRMALSMAVAFVLVAPHGLWASRHRDQITATSSKFGTTAAKPQTGGSGPAVTFTATRLEGIGEAVWAITRFAAPLVGIHAVILFVLRKRKVEPSEGADSRPPEGKLICRALLFIALMLLVGILIVGPTNFKDRWFQPILVCLPVLLAVRPLRDWNFTDIRRLWSVGILVMLAVATIIPARVFFADRLGHAERLNFPLPELGRILNEKLPPGVVVMADSSFLAGNLRLAMRDRKVISKTWGDPDGQPCCIVWAARKSPKPPADLKNAAEGMLRSDKTVLLKGSLRNQASETYPLGASW